MYTLPVLANRWQVGIDALRAVVRTDPVLAALGSRVGSTRGYTDAEAQQIYDAFQKRMERIQKRRQVAGV